MPIISQFYGIIVTMYYNEENGKHNKPYIQARYNNAKVVYDFECNIIEGSIPYKKRKW